MTLRFGMSELGFIEGALPAQLISIFMVTDPLVVLRALAEVMLNGDEEKLKELISDDGVWTRWQSYAKDDEVDDNDHGYAKKLRQKKAELTGSTATE